MVKIVKCAFVKVCFQITPQIMLGKDGDSLCAFEVNTTDDEVTDSVYERGVAGRRLPCAL